eukprot:5975708-Amphidinium_carterae.1
MCRKWAGHELVGLLTSETLCLLTQTSSLGVVAVLKMWPGSEITGWPASLRTDRATPTSRVPMRHAECQTTLKAETKLARIYTTTDMPCCRLLGQPGVPCSAVWLGQTHNKDRH